MNDFKTARDKHLATLDKAYDDLRRIVMDPKWCNDKYKGYVEAVGRLTEAIDRMKRLNEVESEAQ